TKPSTGRLPIFTTAGLIRLLALSQLKMKTSTSAFHGSIPEYYDRHLGPAFFEPYADDLIARLPKRKYEAVLELACGTGIVTRKLRDHLSSETRLVATDLNRAM